MLEGVNPSCGDDIWLKLKVEDGVIRMDPSWATDARFPRLQGYDAGPGDRKEKEEAVKLAENFFQMIRGTAGRRI